MLKVGDYVRIKSEEEILSMNDDSFRLTDGMKCYCGRLAKVECILDYVCRLNIDGKSLMYGWRSFWLEKITGMEIEIQSMTLQTEKENPIMKNEITVDIELNKKIDEMVTDMIQDVRIIAPNQVVEVTFKDGVKEKAVCADEDTYSFDTAITICIAKYFLGGTKDYCKVIKNANKIIANKEKEAEKIRVTEEQKAKRVAKYAAYKQRKAAKKLEQEIEMRKEAYKRAMRELEEEKKVASCK